MYEELVKKIRHCATDPMHCLSCGEDKDGRCFKRLMTQAADAIEQLSNAGSAYGRGWTLGYDAGREESKPRWIPVTEQLPEIGEIVLAYVDELRLIIRAKIVDAKDYRGERRIDWARVDPDPFFLSCYKITHWMPLPKPPKEET